MTALLDLPVEVLQLIISYVCSISDIAALGVQCQRLHGICDVATRKKYYRIRLHKESNLRQGTKLLLSILRNPILGTYVRELEFDDNYPKGKFNWEEYNGPDEEEAERVYSAIRRAGFSSTEQRRLAESVLEDAEIHLEFRIVRGSKVEVPSEGRSVILKRQALAALFISVSPNLESLTLCPMVVTTSPATFPMRTVSTEQFIKSRGYYIRESSPLIEFLDRVNFNIVKTEALQHVRHLKFDFDKLRFRHAYNSFTLLENLNLVHRLPHLESIRIAAMTEIHPEDFELWNSYYEQATVRPCSNSSNINKIHLENSYVGTRYLEYLIDICKRLTKFTYWTGPVPELYRSNPRFFGVIALKTLARALLSQRHNLETLDLVIDDAYADFDTEEPPLQHQPYLGGQNHGTESDNLTENLTGAGGILVHFTSLTRLTLNVRLFFYFAMGVRPITMGGQDLHGSQGARSQSYRPAGAGQSLEHDDRTDMHEDLEVNHMPGSKDERYQPLIKTLPPRLEYLCIRGYHRGLNTFHDSLLSSLMTDIQEEGLLPHLNVSGVW